MTGREMLRDKFSNLIGKIETNGSRHTLGDKASNLLSSYDAHDDWDSVTNTETPWAGGIC